MTERRWLEDGAPPELRTMLESAVIDEPTPEQLASLRARVDGLMTTPPGAPAGGAASGVAAKLIGGVALLTLGVGGGVWLARREVPPQPAPVVQEVAPPVAEEKVEQEQKEAPPEPVVVAPVPAPVPAQRPAVKRVEPAPPPAPTVDEELELLQTAMAAPSPAESLALVEQHIARFPDSGLAQEREVLAVKALMKADRVDEAKARAERFKRRWPTSPHLLRVESLIAK